MKNYIGISRDHSGSMESLRNAAVQDYNALITAIRESTLAEKQDTIVSVVKCGTGPKALVQREIVYSTAAMLQPLTSAQYDTVGPGTPLFDSVGELIQLLSAAPDANDPNVSFVIMVVTDGAENSSREWLNKLGPKIRELIMTDRWTFTFRVPKGGSQYLTRLGIPAGNIYEWDPFARGSMEQSTFATQQAVRSFYQYRSAGIKSTNTFYANLSSVTSTDVKTTMKDISHEVTKHAVRQDGIAIKDFIEQELRVPYALGHAFYQLTKREKAVQEQKQFVIFDKQSSRVYAGTSARRLLGLPSHGTIALAPSDHQNFEIFIQSTSVNRKLVGNTSVLYWPAARPM